MAEVLSAFSYYWLSGRTPYHQAFETLRATLKSKPHAFETLKSLAPDTSRIILDALSSGIHPNVYAILTEQISEENYHTLCLRYFDDETAHLHGKTQTIARYFDIKEDLLLGYANLAEYGPPQLLVCSKAIRLYLATGLSVAEIKTLRPPIKEGLIQLKDQLIEQDITLVFGFFELRERYGLELEDTLIIQGREIAQQSPVPGKKSQFERIFSDRYQTDKKDIDCALQSDNGAEPTDHLQQKSILKRVFQTDDYGLMQMALFAFGKSSFPNNVSSLTKLYALFLLRRIYGLSFDDFCLSQILWPKKASNAHDYRAIADVLDFALTWLEEKSVSCTDLFCMLTQHYSVKQTPFMEQLAENLSITLSQYPGLFSETNESPVYAVMAPDIFSAFELDSPLKAEEMLLWCDAARQDGDASCRDVAKWIFAQRNTSLSTLDAKVVRFFQRLTQLEMIRTRLEFGSLELSVIAAWADDAIKNGAGDEKDNVTVTFDTLVLLSKFSDILLRSGQKAPDLIDLLIKEKMTIGNLAENLGIPSDKLILASEQFFEKAGLDTEVTSIRQMVGVLKWYDTANLLGISPATIQKIFTLPYNNYSTFPDKPDDLDIKKKAEELTGYYTAWQNCSDAVLAGIDESNALQVSSLLKEKLSGAFCYYLFNILRYPHDDLDPVVGLHEYNREALYSYLLIDNNVSSAVKTTRISEAIASIQLYINRSITGIESGAEPGSLEKPFFTNWERFNKRYSTWAGGSMLAYFPENYIDPSMRIGQTKMMDALLDQISQSKINTDTVEDAFMNYLTQFEQVANLEVVSGYHDAINTEHGVTYFLGRNYKSTNDYYWRTVNFEKCVNGTFSANAWGEWKQISFPINPYKNCIRPVIMHSRINLVWIEKGGKQLEYEGDKLTSKGNDYHLKLSHVRYDGSWSPPLSFSVDNKIWSDLSLGEKEVPGFFATIFSKKTGTAAVENMPEEEVLMVFLYKKIQGILLSLF